MINTADRKKATYFTGVEVENTIMKGEKTLFVVGVQPVDDIDRLAQDHGIRHVYFGTSQSFNPVVADDWRRWDTMISGCLMRGYFVSLDFDVRYAKDIHEEAWCEHDKFIPMISVKIPYIRLFNYNATLKIDDITWGDTNPGVWSHHLNKLMTKDSFTAWHEYVGDETL